MATAGRRAAKERPPEPLRRYVASSLRRCVASSAPLLRCSAFFARCRRRRSLVVAPVAAKAPTAPLGPLAPFAQGNCTYPLFLLDHCRSAPYAFGRAASASGGPHSSFITRPGRVRGSGGDITSSPARSNDHIRPRRPDRIWSRIRVSCSHLRQPIRGACRVAHHTHRA